MGEATYAVSREELERLSKFADVPMIFHETPESYRDEAEIDNADDLLHELAHNALSNVGDGFARFAQANAARIHKAARYSTGIAEALVLGYRLGIELDPLRALSLFQRAEVGLRMDIADGLYYYRKRLTEAIKGQAQARAMLDGDSMEVTTQQRLNS